MKLANKIRQLRREKGLTRDAFAKILGVSSKTVFRYERGERTPTLLFLKNLARWAGVGLDWLIQKKPLTAPIYDGESVKETELVRVPVLEGMAALGAGGIVEDSIKEYIHIAKDFSAKEVFAVRAEGASMEPAVCDGDIVLVDSSAKNLSELAEKIIIANIGGTFSVKRLMFSSDGYFLKSDNPSFQKEPIFLSDEISVLGRVAAILRKLE